MISALRHGFSGVLKLMPRLAGKKAGRILGFDHGDGEESKIAERIEKQPGHQERMKDGGGRAYVRTSDRREMSLDGKVVTLQEMSHAIS